MYLLKGKDKRYAVPRKATMIAFTGEFDPEFAP